MMRLCSTAALLVLYSLTCGAQSYILRSELPRDSIIGVADRFFGGKAIEAIYPRLGIYRIDIDPEMRGDATPILSMWLNTGICDIYYPDRKVTLRATPDDPLYGEQWDLDRINCQDAWDITTGGLTSTGDTIVVAILDAGYDLDHADLRANVWKNLGEVPDDGVDNDNNGYIDDYYGAYTQGEGDDHPIDPHGTSVAGIIGAKGNNGRGVSGVNWDVKFMPVSGISRESEVIESYNYVAEFRRKWNESNGSEGAFVVASNLSAGIDGAFAQDHPLWCDVYDDLGQLGIVSVIAVTDNESLIDEEGDVPGTCPSEFMIAVTNTTIDDIREQPSGYGPIHVDLGAPGSGTLTVIPNDDYDFFNGTSSAAPHVAGTIGLMYAVECDNIMPTVLSDPAAAARRMRNTVLTTVNPLFSLTNTTASGGRLDAGDAVLAVCDAFTPIAQKLRIVNVYPNPTHGAVTLEVQPESYSEHRISVYDAIGRLVHDEVIYPQSSPFKHALSVDAQVTGLYFAVVASENQITGIKFVVQ